jgi:hypothetical protein
MGGMRRGLQAAVAKITAPKHPHAKTDFIKFAIWFPTTNGTQKRPRRDPHGCDASHGLTMFRAVIFGRGTGLAGTNPY